MLCRRFLQPRFLGALSSLAMATLFQFVAASSARADVIPPAGYESFNYNVTLENGIQQIADIAFLQQLAVGRTTARGATWSYSLASGSSTASFFWPQDSAPIVGTLGIGLAYGVPNDPSPTLVIFGNFTPSQIGESFSSLFPDASESDLISNLEVLDSFVPPNGPTGANGFAVSLYNDAATEGLFIAPNTSFDVVAFSNGQLIGTGTLDAITATPEPSSLSLVFLGIALFAGTFGHRKLSLFARRVPHS